jgi:hypothetical protein
MLKDGEIQLHLNGLDPIIKKSGVGGSTGFDPFSANEIGESRHLRVG